MNTDFVLRLEPPPLRVEAWMERFGGRRQEIETHDTLLGAGTEALRQALMRPGRDREGAYALLAADALVTRAVGRAVEAADPEDALRALLVGVAAEAPEAPG